MNSKTLENKILLENNIIFKGKWHSGLLWGKSASKCVKTLKFAKTYFKFEICDLKTFRKQGFIRK